MSRSRNWLMTLNNPDVPTEEYLERLHRVVDAQYTVGQLEKGENGTPHIQFFMNFKNAKNAGGIKKHDKRLHIEIVKVNNGADTYCMKEETRLEGPFEYGTKPVRRNDKHDWEQVREMAKQGKLDDLPADIYVKHYSNLLRIAKDNLTVADSPGLRGIWICGKSGIGKSRLARDITGNIHYPKLCNKWWDGYRQERFVIMDDLDKNHAVLGYHLKKWADRYGEIGETKGGVLPLGFRWFIVTSQYHPDQVFEDGPTRAAIARRFKLIDLEADTLDPELMNYFK